MKSLNNNNRNSNSMPTLFEVKDRTFPVAQGVENLVLNRKNIADRIEKQLNHVWYHLFKIMKDIQSRKIACCNPSAYQETLLLTDYAKRALALLAKKTQIDPTFMPNDKRIETLENEAKKISNELNRILFTDTIKQNTNSDEAACESEHASKYKRWVLEACGLKDENDDNDELLKNRLLARKTIRRQTTFANYILPSQRQINNLAPIKIVPEPSKLERKITVFTEPPIWENMNNNELFRSEFFVTSLKGSQIKQYELVPPKTRTEAQSPQISMCKSPVKSIYNDAYEEYFTPYTKHAESIARPNEYQLQEIDKIQSTLREGKSKFMKSIYGIKKINSPVCKERIMKNNTKEVYKFLMEKRDSLKIGKKGPPSRNIPSKFYRTMPNTKILSPQSASNYYAQSKKSNIMPATASPISIPKNRAKRILILEKNKEKANKLLTKCEVIQSDSEKDLINIQAMGKNFKDELHTLESQIKNNKNDKETYESEKNTIEQAKFLTQRKHLFIYGKKGMGRFLNSNGRDLIHVSDMLMKLNPKYDFLRNRLTEILSLPEFNPNK